MHRLREKRAKLTDKEKHTERLKSIHRMREKRAKRTDEENLSKCAKNRQRTRNKRAQKTDWNLQNKCIRNAYSMKQKRNMQTAVEKNVIKAKQRKRMSVFREQQDKVLTYRKLCLNGPNHVCAS